MERKDAWSYEEDLLLAQTVLSNIQGGETQLNAFEEVAHKLSRTSAACGFRWNSTVRKQYEKEIAQAKQTRHRNKSTRVKVSETSIEFFSHSNETPFDNIINTLIDIKQEYLEMKNQIDEMRNKIALLTNQLETKNNPTPSEDIQSLLQIIKRAENLGMFDKIKTKEKPAG